MEAVLLRKMPDTVLSEFIAGALKQSDPTLAFRLLKCGWGNSSYTRALWAYLQVTGARGAPQDVKAGIRALQESERPEAKLFLAELFAKGVGVQQDLAKAEMLTREAIESEVLTRTAVRKYPENLEAYRAAVIAAATTGE
jgi:hypothetical protein